MNMVDLHQKTFEWLEDESVKYTRLFQLARTKKEKESAKKKIQEIRGRLLMEGRSMKIIMDNQL